MSLRCTRSWQAQAREDARLPPADERSFELHAATCDACAREVRTLSALRETALRLPVLSSTPLERRRLRHELLRRASTSALARPDARRARVAMAIGALACAVAIVLGLRSRPASLVTPTFQLSASSGARWAAVERTSTLRLSIGAGHFQLAVDPLHAGQRFVLQLPDGELEVKGTRFVVETDGRQTRSVRVLEGHVALRLQHQPERSLRAGDRYPAAPVSTSSAWVAPPPVASTPPRALATASAVAPTAAATSHMATSGVSGTNASASLRKSSPRGRTAQTAGHDFADAVSAFSAGDYGRAESLFVAFTARHPADSRVEDALFLRSVARFRRGDATGAAALAREYLRSYPNGLRVDDATRLTR